jgi:hypothetical protein
MSNKICRLFQLKFLEIETRLVPFDMYIQVAVENQCILPLQY